MEASGRRVPAKVSKPLGFDGIAQLVTGENDCAQRSQVDKASLSGGKVLPCPVFRARFAKLSPRITASIAGTSSPLGVSLEKIPARSKTERGLDSVALSTARQEENLRQRKDAGYLLSRLNPVDIGKSQIEQDQVRV